MPSVGQRCAAIVNASLDRAAHARRGDARSQLDRGVEVVRLEEEEAAERLLGLGERTVRDQRLAVLHAHRRRGRRVVELLARGAPGVWLIAPHATQSFCCSSGGSAATSSRVKFWWIRSMNFMASPSGE
jgi:hypothetical protein